MRVTENLLALEKVIEQGILGFFVLLGAGEAPENWQPELQEITANADGRDRYKDHH